MTEMWGWGVESGVAGNRNAGRQAQGEPRSDMAESLAGTALLWLYR